MFNRKHFPTEPTSSSLPPELLTSYPWTNFDITEVSSGELIDRVEYSKQEWKCAAPCKATRDGVQLRKIRIGELIWMNTGTKKHWGCLSEKNRNNIRLRVSGEDHLNGFNDLLVEDKIRVVSDMGWGSAAKYINIRSVSPLGSIYTGPHQRSVSVSKADNFEIPVLPSEKKIGAQHSGGFAGNRDADPIIEYVLVFKTSSCIKLIVDPRMPVVASTSRISTFEPIISFPDGPLPPLDFRFRAPASAPSHKTMDISRKFSSYKENPTSIVGKKFRFNDGNRIWEASEIVFGKKGWGSVTVEGEDESYKFDYEVLMSMLKHGVLDEA
ncbi:hypothetical protein CVT25_010450 [Psilocybe cyanescens]|uniref:Uncharacterized protein n=1 Tax=Psilocybe cyanescens TaxID=93625 RepID=A0A409VTY2_PSICY|nr:hypothetical protein CVT25_010450 [Psilocybe cyanescens]